MAKSQTRQTGLKDELQDRKNAERNALNTVAEFAENLCFSEDVLQPMLHRLMVTHYDDAIEERSIANKCGYPCCSSRIARVKAGQKYHISLAAKKVYDSKELQMFCSLFCYKASNYVKSQLSTEPVWVRSATPTQISFLRKDSHVHTKLTASHKEIVFPNVTELTVNDGGDDDGDDECSEFSVPQNKVEKPTLDISLVKSVGGTTSSTPNSKGIDIDRLKGILLEWNRRPESGKDLSSSLNPSVIGTESSQDARRILEVFSKSPEMAVEMRSHLTSLHQQSATDSNQSQMIARRRIVKEKIHNSLRQILNPYNIPMADVWRDSIRDLSNFNFTKNNIVMKPREWKIVSYLLLRRLAESNPSLCSILEARQETKNAFLDEMNLTYVDLESLQNALFPRNRLTASSSEED